MSETPMRLLCCGTCGINHQVPAEYDDARRRDSEFWSCPNGHRWRYSETRADALEKKLARTEAARQNLHVDLDLARRQRDGHARSAAAYKGQATRLRNKIEAASG